MLNTLKMIGVLLVGMVLMYGIITVGLMGFQSVYFMAFFVVVIISTLFLYGGYRRISRGERVSGSILLLAGAGCVLAIYSLRYIPLPP